MSLVFSAVIPNDPRIADELSSKGTHSQTFSAIQTVEGELYFMKPDTVILLTEYGGQIPELENTNIASTLDSACVKRKTFTTDVELATHMKTAVDNDVTDIPMTIIADQSIPSEISSPLTLLLNHLPDTKVIIISTGQLTDEQHKTFGTFLQHEINKSNKRIALIATGHLAIEKDHDRTFDSTVMTSLRGNTPLDIEHIQPAIRLASKADVMAPLLILLSTLATYTVTTEVVSYEQLYDAGQIVVEFQLR